MQYYFQDRKLLKKLADYDIIILSECIPNAYLRGYYDIESLRKITGRPVCLYEVYYLGNSNTHTRILKEGNHHGIERFDWNFSVSGITEKKETPSPDLKWSVIGLNLAYTGLAPQGKEEFIVLVDFEQEGFEESRKEQLEVLRELNIKTIVLDGRYSIEEIRTLYKKAAVLLVQFPEAFGLPIAECLACGTCIMVREAFWAMSWRKQVPGTSELYLPECFIQYGSRAGLKEELLKFKNGYHRVQTPLAIYKSFIENYPEFFYGDIAAVEKAFNDIAAISRSN